MKIVLKNLHKIGFIWSKNEYGMPPTKGVSTTYAYLENLNNNYFEQEQN